VAGPEHVGIGSDLDGIGSTPVGLESVEAFPVLLAELLRRGWSEEEVVAAAGGNLLRVFAEAERVAARLQRERTPEARLTPIAPTEP
jgi:membrane dipeptidase